MLNQNFEGLERGAYHRLRGLLSFMPHWEWTLDPRTIAKDIRAGRLRPGVGISFGSATFRQVCSYFGLDADEIEQSRRAKREHESRLKCALKGALEARKLNERMRSQGMNLKVESTLVPDQRLRQDEILSEQDPEAALRFAVATSGADVAALEALVLEHGEPMQLFRFARDVPGASVADLQEAFVRRAPTQLLRVFACDVHGADTMALEQDVLSRGTAEDAYLFARDVPGANIEALGAKVLAEAGPTLLVAFARDVHGADLPAYAERLAEIGTTQDALEFLWQVPNSTSCVVLSSLIYKIQEEGAPWNLYLLRAHLPWVEIKVDGDPE